MHPNHAHILATQRAEELQRQAEEYRLYKAWREAHYRRSVRQWKQWKTTICGFLHRATADHRLRKF